jgi:predicted RecB family nuclease
VQEIPSIPKSTVEIYFDVEGIPDINFYYLIGIVIKGREKNNYYYFWANDKYEESVIFQNFLTIINQYSEFTLFHYGSYETTYLKKMSKNLDRVSQKRIDKILKSCCNILSFLHSNIYLPTYTNGLKDVANIIGFRWSDKNASGLQSIIWRKKLEKTLNL